jgi:hypothetical protein
MRLGRGLVMSIGLVALLVAIGALGLHTFADRSHSSTTLTDRDTSVASFGDHPLSFRYPTAWGQPFKPVSLNRMTSLTRDVFGFISPLSLRDPYVTTDNGYKLSPPIDQLPPGGMLATIGAEDVSAVDGPAGSESRTLDGHRAVLTVNHPGDCGSIGGTTEYTAWIDVISPDDSSTILEGSSYATIHFCVREPIPSHLEAQIRQVLGSATVGT